MLSTTEIIGAALRFRVDAIVFALLVVVTCRWTRQAVRRPDVDAPDEFGFGAIATFIVAAALLADATARFLGYPDAATLSSVALGRALVWSVATLVGVILLYAAARSALLRALRLQADTGRQLQQARADAAAAQRSKLDFLAVISHELRTPLHAITGFAVLLKDSKLDERQRSHLATLRAEAGRLGALLEDVLDLCCAERGELTLQKVPFAPVEIAHEVLRAAQRGLGYKRLDVQLDTDIARPLLVMGDVRRFRQVLTILTDNAVRFTPSGAITLRLHWTPGSAVATQGQLALQVRDTGIGIAPERLPTLFDVLTPGEAAPNRTFTGAGLSLALAHRVVRAFGGALTVQSTPGVGTEFSCSLPCTPAPEIKPTPPVATLAPSATGPVPRVLVVDDMETNRFLLEVFLRRNGFEPTLANGGEEAVRLAAAQSFDAILMDVSMPGMDGYTATQRIRAAEPAGRRTPIIALTASFGQVTRDRCLAAGMDEHMTKPLDLRKFKEILEALVAGHAAIALGT